MSPHKRDSGAPENLSVFRSTDRMLGFEPSDVGSIPARPAIKSLVVQTLDRVVLAQFRDLIS